MKGGLLRCLLLPRILLLALGITPPQRRHHLLGPVRRWADEGLNVVVVDHFLFQQGVRQLERTKGSV